MFRLNNRDIVFYLVERICFWGVCFFGLGIAYLIAMLVLTYPQKLPTIMILINYIVGLGTIVGSILGFVPFPELIEKDESRRELVLKWRKITHLGIFLFPRDGQEVEAMAPHLRNILVAYASASNDAFKERDEARSNLDASCIGKIAKPADLSSARLKKIWARVAFERAEQKAEWKHKEYLAAWDYLTKDRRDLGVGLLRNLQDCNPEDFRKNVYAVD